jgi:glutamate--cysteine ligase
VQGWSAEDRQRLRDEVPRIGLTAKIEGRTLVEVGKDALAIARRGLARRARKNAAGADETGFLAPLDEIAATGRSRAAVLLDRYANEWRGSVLPAFEQCRF